MVTSMAAFAVADTLIKLASISMSPAHTTLVLCVGAATVFSLLAKLQGDPLWHRDALKPVMLFRYIAEMVGSFGIVLALVSVDLSTLGAIMQATPLLAVAGAVLLLGEKVSWRRWSAILVGFLGVLMIIKPGAQSFDTSVLWAVIAMVGLSARDLTSRALPATLSTSQVAAFTMIAITPVSILWCALSQDTLLPQNPDWWLVIGMTGFGAFGYMLLTSSVRMAQVAVVSPFRYSRLIFLLALGITVFGERPDILTLTGATLIIASGIYTMWRDRLARLKAAANPPTPSKP